MKQKIKSAEERHSEFIKGLTALSKKTGVVIKVIGGVIICSPAECKELVYSDDISSGDINPSNY